MEQQYRDIIDLRTYFAVSVCILQSSNQQYLVTAWILFLWNTLVVMSYPMAVGCLITDAVTIVLYNMMTSFIETRNTTPVDVGLLENV